MRGWLKTIGSLVIILGLALPGLTQSSKSITISATISPVEDLSVSISRIEGSNWYPNQTSIDFGTLSYDITNNIFRANCYYAVDVGVSGNVSNWIITHSVSSIKNAAGTDSLDNNINVSFNQQLDDTTANEIGYYSYAQSNRSFNKSQISPGWLRIYYGIATGSGDASGVESITTAKPAGTYTGTITLTLTPQ